jgi:hypothetical protein
VKRTRLQRSKPFLARVAPRRRGRNGKPPTTVEIAARELFKTAVCSQPCIGSLILGHECVGPLQAMHVVPKQTLKRRGLRHLLWDPVNGVCGCRRIHTRHDGKVELIPRELLPARCVRWAADHDVLDALERHWPAGSPFTDRLTADAYQDGTPNPWADRDVA